MRSGKKVPKERNRFGWKSSASVEWVSAETPDISSNMSCLSVCSHLLHTILILLSKWGHVCEDIVLCLTTLRLLRDGFKAEVRMGLRLRSGSGSEVGDVICL